MKQYHTSITIAASVEEVWSALTNFEDYPNWNPLVGKLEGSIGEGARISTFIVPLNKTYHPTITQYQPMVKFEWLGAQGAAFLLAGRHYYTLEKISEIETKLLHGEYFTGLFSVFIPKKLLIKMEAAFTLHNQLLKQRIENGKK